jgi:competence protein ComEA
MWQWDRRIQGVLLLLAAALVFAGGIRYSRWQAGRSPDNSPVVNATSDTVKAAPHNDLAVQVAGAVAQPGVFSYPKGTRVETAVKQAQPTPAADLSSLNLARLLVDGEKIYIPRLGEVPASGNGPPSTGGSATTSSPNTSGKVNLNTANAQELDKLPGIGLVYAQRIVDYRNTHGLYRSADDLLNVSGIGTKRLEQIRDLLIIQ